VSLSVLGFLIIAMLAMTVAEVGNDVYGPKASRELRVQNTAFAFTRVDGRLYLTVFGEIMNPTGHRYRNVYLEARFLDASGKQIDLVSRHIVDIVVLPHDTSHFRIMDLAAREPADYSAHTVTIRSAGVRWND